MRKFLVVALGLALTIGGSLGATPLPAGEELKKLTDETLLSFNRAVQKADFTEFHQSLAKIWQVQTTPAQLKEIFQGFIDRKFDMEDLVAKRTPRYEPAPKMDADNFMEVNGAYDVEGDSVTFQLKYNHEGAWKLAGINVHFAIGKEKRQTIPSEAELKKMADATFLAFNSAVQSQDFAAFYASTAKLWQEQTSPAKLKQAFQGFIDQKFDIAPAVKKVKPSFEPPPEIDSDGFLVVHGSYPVKPDKLSFELKYLMEEGAWKLVGINVEANRAGQGKGDDE